jgi:uncharacterized protein involved in exopolysaccharide biosynthesis
MKKRLFSAPSTDHISNALSAWRLLLVAALMGGLIGAALYQLWTPPFRAETRVVIDQNLEQVLPEAPDREVFYFLERETQKLEELAWSDVVLEQVAEQIKDVTVEELRDGMLQLSQPGDGGWRFYGISDTRERAKLLANRWADVFVDLVRAAVLSANELIAVRSELSSLTDNLTDETEQKRQQLEVKANALEDSSYGLHPDIQLYQSQKKAITINRIASIGTYIFTGAISALFLTLFFNIITSDLRKVDVVED